MKQSKVIKMFLSTAMLVSAASALAIGTASAADDQSAVLTSAAQVKAAASKVKAGNTALTIDGSKVTVRTIQTGQAALYALRDVANALGATVKSGNPDLIVTDAAGQHTLTLKADSKNYLLDGTSHQFTITPVKSDGTIYVELKAIIEGLGGEILTGSQEIFSVARLSGQFANPRFHPNGNVIVNKEDGNVSVLLQLNVHGGYSAITSEDNAVGAVISPDGRTGAFTDESGKLYLIDIASGYEGPLSKDTSVKTDLTWSADGKKLYFIQGDKQEKIAYINVDTGKITEVLADKVENKSEVQVSADGKKLVYFVNITGKADNDKDSTEESLQIDYSKAGTQVFSLDLTTSEAAAVQWTKDADNKLYLSLLPDGKVVYVSADPEGIVSNNVLKVISADGAKTANLAADIDVIHSRLMHGKLIVVGASGDGLYKVYEISSTGIKKELYSSQAEITEAAVSSSGTIALIADGKVVLVQDGKVTALTQ